MARKDIPEYSIWKAMRARCLRSTSSGFYKYGSRGISICGRWDDFSLFLADMGSRPSSKHSIDRIDNNGNYEPGNCQWSLPKQQSRNRRTVRFITWDGYKVSIPELCERFSISQRTFNSRMRFGWNVAAALTTPTAESGQRFRPRTREYRALALRPEGGFDPRNALNAQQIISH